jgi:hypothetical protein
MTKPVTIPNTFATATTAIPLSQLDSDFSTVATALNDANTYSNYAADTGVANAYVVTLTGVSTTYSAGLRIQFKAGNANTGASTLNVNGGGTKNITYQDASALSAGTIAANAIVDVMYDGTQFLLMNDPAGTVGTGDVVGPAGATDNAIVRFDGATGKLVQNSVVTIADSTGDVAGVGALSATGNVSFDGGTFVFNESGADKDFRIEGDTDANLFFTDASTDRVGIGTSSPGAQLQLNKSGTGDYTTFRLSNSGASGKTYEIGVGGNAAAAGYANNLYFYDSTAASLRMTLDSSGNLGLGVSPSAWLSSFKAIDVTAGGAFVGTGGGALVASNSFFNTSGSPRYKANGFATYYDGNVSGAGAQAWYTAPSGTAGNAITFTQAMTLDASGRLLVGSTTSVTPIGLQLQSQNGLWSAGIHLRGPSTSTGCYLGASTSSTTTDFELWNEQNGYLRFATNNTERFRIGSGGEIYFPGVGTTASAANAYLDNGSTPANQLLRSTSSLRYKTDVETLDHAKADAVLNLRPVWYRSKAEADRKDWSWYGLIAEEVAQVEPRLVHWSYPEDQFETIETQTEIEKTREVEVTPAVLDDEGNVVEPAVTETETYTETETKSERKLKADAQLAPDGVQYDRLTVMLLDIVKRQNQRIEQLEAKVAALEAQ